MKLFDYLQTKAPEDTFKIGARAGFLFIGPLAEFFRDVNTYTGIRYKTSTLYLDPGQSIRLSAAAELEGKQKLTFSANTAQLEISPDGTVTALRLLRNVARPLIRIKDERGRCVQILHVKEGGPKEEPLEQIAGPYYEREILETYDSIAGEGEIITIEGTENGPFATRYEYSGDPKDKVVIRNPQPEGILRIAEAVQEDIRGELLKEYSRFVESHKEAIDALNHKISEQDPILRRAFQRAYKSAVIQRTEWKEKAQSLERTLTGERSWFALMAGGAVSKYDVINRLRREAGVMEIFDTVPMWRRWK